MTFWRLHICYSIKQFFLATAVQTKLVPYDERSEPDNKLRAPGERPDVKFPESESLKTFVNYRPTALPDRWNRKRSEDFGNFWRPDSISRYRWWSAWSPLWEDRIELVTLQRVQTARLRSLVMLLSELKMMINGQKVRHWRERCRRIVPGHLLRNNLLEWMKCWKVLKHRCANIFHIQNSP